MPDRKLNFVGAGGQDISEVVIDSESHAVTPAGTTRRVTYTVSYPEPAPKRETKPFTLEESFAEAAKAIIEDAKNRGVEPGDP